MTQIIATFKLKREFDIKTNNNQSPLIEKSIGEDIKNSLQEVAINNDMELISWGTI